MPIFPSETLSEVLVEESGRGNLNMVELRQAVARRGLKVTPQAVYKALRQLRQRDMVFLQKGEVSLSVRWLQQLEMFVSLAQRAYADPSVGSGGFLQLRDKDSISYSFNNPVQVDVFWNHVLYILFAANPSQDRWFAYASHHWFLLGRRKEELALMAYMKRNGIRYMFTAGHRSALDRVVAKDFDGDLAQYHMLEAPLFTNRRDYLGRVLNVFGDYVIEAHYDKQTVEEIEAFYGKYSKADQTAVAELEEKVVRQAKIKLTIRRDAAKARRLAKTFERNFYLGKKSK